MTPSRWRRSSYSSNSNSNDCVEARTVPGGVAVRDSKDPHGPALPLTPEAWCDFTARVKTGG
ncbi:MAG TPA: DUF397 domain-containing protein [Streptosporangiaceae bacterium]|jgi:hypothetical protein|nr:DUF397 domain-containing protein [Streptosporangiaceae bacterium]